MFAIYLYFFFIFMKNPNLEIVGIFLDGDERVVIQNKSSVSVPISGLEITDHTMRQLQPHIFRIPMYVDGSDVWLGPGEYISLHTGAGRNEWVEPYKPGQSRTLHLYWDRSAKVWNNQGDHAYLRRSDGTIIDHWPKVGAYR